MTTERIDIEITDKVSPKPAKKLREIASEALKADSAIDRLQASVTALDASALTRLATASSKLTNAQARETSATARLMNARSKMNVETSRAAQASARLATEQARTKSATEAAAQAATRARSALLAEESASIRLAAAKRREAAATDIATGATKRNSATNRRAAASTGLAAHQMQNLTYQVNDVAVGLMSGQRPLTVLMQQGSQISTVFGPGTGLTGIMKGLGQAVFGIARQFAPVLAVLAVGAGVFGALTHEIGETTDVAVGMGDVIKASMQLTAEAIMGVLAPAIDFIAPAFKAAYDFVIDATKFVINGVLGYWVGTINAIKAVVGDVPGTFEAAWKLGFNAIIDVTQFGMNGVISIFDTRINNVVGLFSGGYNAVVAVWNLLPAAFSRLGSLAINGLISIVEAGVKGIISAINSVFEFIGSAATLVGLENPFKDLLDPSVINLDEYKRAVAPVGPGISAAIGDSFRDAFAQDYTQGLREALDISGFKQELSTTAGNTATAIEQAYTDAFSTDFAGGAFNAIRERSIELARERLAAEAENETATGAGNAQLSVKQKLISGMLKPLIDYKETTAALNELLSEGVITLGQYSEALASISLVKSLRDIDASLVGTPFADAAMLDEVRIAEQERLNIVQQALEARIIGEQDAADRIIAINRQAAMDIQAIEAARNSMILMGASDTFASLADAAKGFAGEQSGIYKAMFIASKAFAIADSIMKIQQGIANAMSLPFPANLAAAGTVAASAASIVSSIQAVTMLKDGGEVFGPGGPREDKVPIMASAGEFVVNARDTARNKPILRAINAGQDVVGRTPVFRNGGEVQPAYRAPVSRSDVSRVGNERQRANGAVTINITTPDVQGFLASESQVASATARAVNRGQRNL